MTAADMRAGAGGAQTAGPNGLLVRSGNFRGTNLDRNINPDASLDGIADLPEQWSNL